MDSAVCSSARLPSGVLEFLTTCPKAGGGVHRWVFKAALMLHRVHCPKSEISQQLAASTAKCGRLVSEREIEDAINGSARVIAELAAGVPAKPRTKWPVTHTEQIEAIVNKGPGLNAFERLSPVTWTDSAPHTEEIIDLLFPGNPLLCIGRTKYLFGTMRRERWRGRLPACQFIVPSPMTSHYGLTQDGRKSHHTLANTGPRRFLIVEFDSGDFDQHAALLWHLRRFRPLVLAVHSGNKSLHGWFNCAGEDDQQLLGFMRRAVELGADQATWTKSQFVRLPDGRRENGKRC
jgi:hypothetical protein